jgi:hypothetical protein
MGIAGGVYGLAGGVQGLRQNLAAENAWWIAGAIANKEVFVDTLDFQQRQQFLQLFSHGDGPLQAQQMRS